MVRCIHTSTLSHTGLATLLGDYMQRTTQHNIDEKKDCSWICDEGQLKHFFQGMLLCYVVPNIQVIPSEGH